MTKDKQFFAREMKSKVGTMHPFDLLIEAQSKAKEVGHDFGSDEGFTAIDDLEDEVRELREAIEDEAQGQLYIRNEIGDVFFSLLNVCRENGIDPHESLAKSTERWLTRKSVQEQKVENSGHTWRDLPADKSCQFWREAKQELKQEEYK